MDVVVTGRHCEITERYRSHVEEKLTRLEKHDHRIIRVQVEVDCEANPRQRDRAVRLELTAFSKGPVIRAEACAADKMAALDLALDKMASQMRRVGLLKAVGGTPGVIAAVLLAQYVVPALLAAAAGLAVGRLLAPVLSRPSAGLIGGAGSVPFSAATAAIRTAWTRTSSAAMTPRATSTASIVRTAPARRTRRGSSGPMGC